ncbi:MAG TPA: NAD(P)/FAD-dependent oxidoreductase [Candidatus Dormibacteraeota bacterium]|nr:NAD(P)/FAD-dependent oxidoreductase [Candidatus Dormibacteraeota bacterium]
MVRRPRGGGSSAPRELETPHRPRVVVIGAGFAGLTVARSLKSAALDVTLLDRRNYHLFTPLLYQVASSLLNPSEIAQPVRKLVRRVRNCVFRLAEVQGFDLENRFLETNQGRIGYDYLVLAAGSVSNYFGNEKLREHSLGLKSLPDALNLRNWVLQRFEMASWEPDPSRRAQLITFTVVGGGPTGVEFAGALLELIHLVLRKDFRGVDISGAKVLLVEASGEILGSFKPRLRRAATRSLARRGVEILLNSTVRDIGAEQLVLTDDRVLTTSSVVWTAGVRGDPLGARLGGETDRIGRVLVGPTLQLPGHPEVLVVGDICGLAGLPMLAQVAIQQARLAARNIRALSEGGEVAEFRYHDRGIMATVGRNSGIAQIGPFQFSGFLGWTFWLVVHLVNILTFRARLLTLLNWAWDYVAVDRPIRLLVRATPRDPASDSVDPAS